MTNCVVLRSSPCVLEAGLPLNCGSAIIIRQPMQRVTSVLLFHSYLSSHPASPSSHAPFLSPRCSVPRYLGNALVMFCSPFSRHSLALEGRRTPLVLLSSTPKQPMWTAPSNPRLTFTLPETTAEKRSMTTRTQNQVFPKALGLPFSYRDI